MKCNTGRLPFSPLVLAEDAERAAAQFGDVAPEDAGLASGLINTSAQVIDLRGRPIPGLYACGDSAGGFGQHGICRGATCGRSAGYHVAQLT